MKKQHNTFVSIILCLMLALTLWAPARAASDTEYKAILEATLENIYFTVTDPRCDSTYGEWAVIAMARGGFKDDAWYGRYLDAVRAKVDSCNGVLHSKKYTEYSRVILGLTAAGQDATKFNTGTKTYDLVSPLLSKQDNGEYWAAYQGNTGTAFAIIALNSRNYLNNAEGRKARAGLLDTLLNAQNSDGGWNINGGGSGIDPTAMSLQALAPYYLSQGKYDALGASHTYAQLKSSVDRALAYLKTQRNDDYGSVEAAAQVVVALAALKRDAANDPILGDALSSVLAYYDGDGVFVHDKVGSEADSQMSIEQAAYALVAYDRWKTGKTSLYDMTEGLPAEISITAPSTVVVEQTDAETIQVTSSVPCIAVVRNEDGTYSRLTPKGSGDTRSFHTTADAVIILVRGDANGDGTLSIVDMIQARAAMLGLTKLDEQGIMSADLDGNGLTLSDILKARAYSLNMTDLDW